MVGTHTGTGSRPCSDRPCSEMKIAIVVHGRFHGFDLARALLQRGNDVTVFTNYPAWAAQKFGVPARHVRSFWPHGIASRLASSWHNKTGLLYPEPWLHPLFGRWASAQLQKEEWDVVHVWSGVAEEILKSLNGNTRLKLVMRGSAHIRAQDRILEQEEKRTGSRIDRPSPWMITREEREYRLADHIVVLSRFAYDTFLAEGVNEAKLCLLPLGTRIAAFRPDPAVIEARCRRILSGEPLRVLYVGALSFRKGLWDMAAIVRSLSNERFQFRLIGPSTPEVSCLLRELRGSAEFISKQRQQRLPSWYAASDLFVFPTIEDGFAVVLTQANAAGLPILTTTHCCGPDLLEEGKTGWVLPIRSPEAFVDHLRWCNSHRPELSEMVRRIYTEFQPRDWNDVAADFEAICLNPSSVISTHSFQ
jgi:glycosyltransferase involved in cell wall biosynthesis